MNIKITQSPDNYSSALLPALYTLTAEPDGEPLDVTVVADDGTTLGTKRFPSSESAEINISCYLRRRLDPRPITERGCGFRLPEGRTVRSFIRAREAESEPRLFTAALRTVAPFELLNKTGTEREIWRGGIDEIALLAEPCTLSAEVSVVGAGRRESAGRHETTVVSPRMAAFVTDTDEILSRLTWADEAERIEVTIKTDGTPATKVTYRVVSRPSEGMLLCWLNTLGVYDRMAFRCGRERTLHVTKERMLATEGYRTVGAETEERLLLHLPPLPSRERALLAEMAASPRLYIATEEGYEEADVTTERIAVSSHETDGTELELRVSKRGHTQKF